ncbi:MAG: hybrid sensor histidine kinase/response regulator transcription factor [Treponema sp.]|nr:hybrid sensor histidine kinase/response regulator transcription factor [Treponema sp.]
MEPKSHAKNMPQTDRDLGHVRRHAIFASMFLVAFAFGTASCVAPAQELSGQNQLANFRDISIRWIYIERSLVETRLAADSLTGVSKNHIIEIIDIFHESVQSFIDSETYQTYLLVATAPPDLIILVSDVLLEIHTFGDLVLSLRKAVLGGDWDKVTLVSLDISSAVNYILIRENQANKSLANTYFNLLLISGGLIVFAGLFICLFYKLMTISHMREEEGSVFSRSVLIAQEEERKRISMELHDTVAQDLNYLSMEMNRIVGIEERSEREKLYAETAAFLSRLGRQVRDICNNLAPPDFGSRGLPDALRQLCFDFGKRSGVACHTDMEENTNLDFLDKEKQLQLFRIVQESLTNVQKHANATKAIVKLCSNADGGCSLSVSDDGVGIKNKSKKGFSGNPPNGGAHLGTRGLKERAALLGGNLTVGNQQGKGTLIQLNIPPPECHADTFDTAKTKILLIDDHALVNTTVTLLLEGTGRFRILGQAYSLKEAEFFVEKAAEKAPQEMPHLIILDIQLGEKNGLDFLSFLKGFCKERKIPKPPVLVCSTFDDALRIQAALKLGAAGYLPKTGDGNSLLDAIDTVLRGEVYVPGWYDAAHNENPGKYGQLTKQELNIIHLVKLNKSNQYIADTMHISKRTVETHISNIYAKTGIGDREELERL